MFVKGATKPTHVPRRAWGDLGVIGNIRVGGRCSTCAWCARCSLAWVRCMHVHVCVGGGGGELLAGGCVCSFARVMALLVLFAYEEGCRALTGKLLLLEEMRDTFLSDTQEEIKSIKVGTRWRRRKSTPPPRSTKHTGGVDTLESDITWRFLSMPMLTCGA